MDGSTNYHLHSAPYNRNDRSLFNSLVEYAQFFTFHLSIIICTNNTTFSSQITFSFECYRFFAFLKTSGLTDCSLSVLDGGPSCLSHSLSTLPRILEKRLSMNLSEKTNQMTPWQHPLHYPLGFIRA